MNAPDTPTLFSSTDFYLVAYLMMRGMRLHKIEPRGEGRSIFHLEDQPDRRRMVEEYLQGEALVDPLKYKEAIQRLKSFKHNAY